MNRKQRQSPSAQKSPDADNNRQESGSIQKGPDDDIVSLNVGGHFYTTTRGTLTRFGNFAGLCWMFRPDGAYDSKAYNFTTTEPFPSLWDKQGRFVIDRDGKIFRHVLNFLRLGELVLPDDFKELRLLEKEAEYYQMPELAEAVRIMMGKKHADSSNKHKSRQNFEEDVSSSWIRKAAPTKLIGICASFVKKMPKRH
uniref:BTB domain-containing protein n=1 Tax=Branchiostoma floridae TaxID=7739 RepID=C3XUT8_BRAFL|eukprot:XP_002612154.1 hypothetical protein BRAFLDRAFT_88893 [Branchiostoma floridae]